MPKWEISLAFTVNAKDREAADLKARQKIAKSTGFAGMGVGMVYSGELDIEQDDDDGT